MTFSGLRSSKALGEEFRQHDGVVTILMCYRRRASPKHCDNMTEVEYGGGGHRTRLRNDLKDQLVCSRVAPCPRIYRSKGGGRPALVARARRRNPPPSRSRIPLFPTPTRRGKGRGRGRRKGGRRPPLS